MYKVDTGIITRKQMILYFLKDYGLPLPMISAFVYYSVARYVYTTHSLFQTDMITVIGMILVICHTTLALIMIISQPPYIRLDLGRHGLHVIILAIIILIQYRFIAPLIYQLIILMYGFH